MVSPIKKSNVLLSQTARPGNNSSDKISRDLKLFFAKLHEKYWGHNSKLQFSNEELILGSSYLDLINDYTPDSNDRSLILRELETKAKQIQKNNIDTNTPLSEDEALIFAINKHNQNGQYNSSFYDIAIRKARGEKLDRSEGYIFKIFSIFNFDEELTNLWVKKITGNKLSENKEEETKLEKKLYAAVINCIVEKIRLNEKRADLQPVLNELRDCLKVYKGKVHLPEYEIAELEPDLEKRMELKKLAWIKSQKGANVDKPITNSGNSNLNKDDKGETSKTTVNLEEKEYDLLTAKYYPSEIISNIGNYIKKPHFEEVLLEAARNYGYSAITNFYEYKNKLSEDLRTKVLEEALKENPHLIFSEPIITILGRELGKEKFKHTLKDVIKKNIFTVNPVTVFLAYKDLKNSEYLNTFLDAIEEATKQPPLFFIVNKVAESDNAILIPSYVEIFQDKLFAIDIIRKAAKEKPNAAKHFLVNYKKCKELKGLSSQAGFKSLLGFNAEILASKDPVAALELLNINNDIEKEVRDAVINAMYNAISTDKLAQIAAFQYKNSENRDLAKIANKAYINVEKNTGKRGLLTIVDLKNFYREMTSSDPGSVIAAFPLYEDKEILIEASKKDPEMAFIGMKHFLNKDYAIEVLQEAARKSPRSAFRYLYEYVNNLSPEDVKKILDVALKIDETALFELTTYPPPPKITGMEEHKFIENYKKTILETAKKHSGEALKNFLRLNKYIPSLEDEFLEIVANDAAVNNPYNAITCRKHFSGKKYENSVIETAFKNAARLDPLTVLRFSDILNNKDYKDEVLKEAKRNFVLLGNLWNKKSFDEAYKYLQSIMGEHNRHFISNKDSDRVITALDKFNASNKLSLECCGISSGTYNNSHNSKNNNFSFVFLNTYKGEKKSHICIRLTLDELRNAKTENDTFILLSKKLDEFRDKPENNYSNISVNLPIKETSALIVAAPGALEGIEEDSAVLSKILSNFETRIFGACMSNKDVFTSEIKKQNITSEIPVYAATKRSILVNLRETLKAAVARADAENYTNPTFIMPYLLHGKESGGLKASDEEITIQEIADVLSEKDKNGIPYCSRFNIFLHGERCFGDTDSLIFLLAKKRVKVKRLISVTSSSDNTPADANANNKNSSLISFRFKDNYTGTFTYNFGLYFELLEHSIKGRPENRSLENYGMAVQFAHMMTKQDSQIKQVPRAVQHSYDPDKHTIYLSPITPEASSK